MRAALVVAMTLVAGLAVAAPKKDFPCKGCVVVPASGSSTPLLIVLHGDGQSAWDALAPWKSAAAKRGITLFAPQVPDKGSWWKWDGPPKWIDSQVDAIDGVDPTRIWVAGWSGGASYLGRRTRDLPRRWAASSIDGGGWAPDDLACPARVAPAYFLVGDKNELHDLAKGLRAYWTQCGAEIVWDLIPDANHAGEWTALTKKSGTILDWFLSHPLPLPLPSTSTSTSPSPSPSPSTSTSTSTMPVSTASEPPQVRGGRCNCSTPGGEASSGWLGVAVLALQRRRRARSPRARPRATSPSH
ncbi:MAG: MYXO-CTERM sorting domain-containing protein [Polyangiales bacterium]